MASYQLRASAITDELEDFLVCDICAEPYDNGTRQARFLDCHHTFCSQCLILLARKGQKNPDTILCPNCRQTTYLPENGIHGLPVNFVVEKLKSISATADKTEAGPSTEGCPVHHNQTIYFFCETCNTAICRDCTVVDHDKTAGHSIINIKDALDAQRHVLQKRISANQTKRTRIQRAIRQVELNVERLHVCRDAVLKSLRSIIQDAHKQLDQGEQVISNVILQQYETEQNNLLDKQLEFQQANELLDKHIDQSEELVNTSDIGGIIKITEKLTNASEISQLDFTAFAAGEKSLPTDMITAATSLNERLCHLGKKHFKSFSPASFVLRNDKSTAGFKSAITITLLNDDSNALPIACCFLAIKITDPCKCTLPVTLDTTQPECLVTFTPQRSGRHDINVMYLGQKLMSEQSYIFVDSNNPVLKIGGLGNGNGRFNSPRDIAIDRSNCLYVADTGNGLIQKFSSDGEFLFQFRVDELHRDHTSFTVDLDFERGLIACTNIFLYNNSAVKGNTMLMFNLEGELCHTYNLKSMSCPLNIAVKDGGDVLISDVRKKCVFKVNRAGDVICRMGDFKYPGCICIADGGAIIVPDADNNCILIFNPDGTIGHRFGTFGEGSGQLKLPFGVATDGDYILVSEGDNNRVQVFQYDGTPFCMIESAGEPLKQPRGLALTDDGHVYVVDRDKHCIKKYKYRNKPGQWEVCEG